MAVTLLDIARIAQVSESAVSRALHDNPRISQATRDRIKKIAADLDFQFNAHAQGLSTSRCQTIGLIIPNFQSDVSHTYYLDLLINDIRAQLSARGYDILVADSLTPDGSSNLRRLVMQGKVDGMVLIIARLSAADRKVLEKHHIPVVLVNSKPFPMADDSLDDLSYFFTDNVAGGRLAARHLLDRGCSSLLCLADQAATPEMVDRTIGFSREAQMAGISYQVAECGSHFSDASTFVRNNLELFAAIDGVFCHTDIMAVATLRALQEVFLKVPESIRIIGYDNIELGTYFTPSISTIEQPRESIAEQAIAHLLGAIETQAPGPAVHVSVVPALVARESS